MAKRLFDIVVSVFALVVLSPVLGAMAILIKLSSRGPVLYRGPRVGRGGTTFLMYKFRTMQVDADRVGGPLVPSGDPRITKLGRTLRKYKLDELPQLVNVLKGEMSLVGPRPEVKQYTDLYSEREREILSLRPGVTDWASLWDADESNLLEQFADKEKAYMELIRPNKIKLELEYVDHHNLGTDLRILFWTAARLVTGRALPPEIAKWIGEQRG